MTLKAKISLIVVFPVFLIFTILALIIASVLCLIGYFISVSGIAEAFIYLGKEVRVRAIKSYFNKLRKKEGINR